MKRKKKTERERETVARQKSAKLPSQTLTNSCFPSIFLVFLIFYTIPYISLPSYPHVLNKIPNHT